MLRKQIEESRNDGNIQFVFKLFDDIKKDHEKIGKTVENGTIDKALRFFIFHLEELEYLKDGDIQKSMLDNIIGRFQYIIDQYAMLINTLGDLDFDNSQVIKIKLIINLYYGSYIETYLFDIEEKYKESNFDYEYLNILIQSGIQLSDIIEDINNGISEEDNNEEE
ncbi:hypothetical protein D1818_05825 [Aquimarina sp. BL5]|uniref:hypothetical protein n=1 Tax=Aquimarina sp. BL5 TaxID=1714860 RepID=UPI000E4E1B87|nr:hypothetical protein [Aquimarina sp. BL5]AXT50369.1 hypothetical protein D1818_05825 [Aquimarina sp. BL5]